MKIYNLILFLYLFKYILLNHKIQTTVINFIKHPKINIEYTLLSSTFVLVEATSKFELVEATSLAIGG